LSDYPEINLARRVLQKFELRPPIDIFALATRYAKVDIIRLPLDIDGVSLHLKIPGRRPIVILNDSRPQTRKRFTLAHELGHVLIPWHIGTILDEIDLSNNKNDLSYWELENEANRFAAELLMPRDWLKKSVDRFKNPCELVAYVTKKSNVSMEAAVIRLQNMLKPGYIFASIDDDGFVVSSGRSHGTLVTPPSRRYSLDTNAAFPACDMRWEARVRDRLWLWWHFASEVKLPAPLDERDWREILDGILCDLHLDPESSIKLKQTINGIVGYVNGAVRRDQHRSTPEGLYAASMQRLDSRALNDPVLRECVTHRYFPFYLARRVIAFGEK
jgi:IrrE N-terminal-like domain